MEPIPLRNFRNIKEGDIVKRMLAGTVPMELKVTKVDEKLIHCGTDDAGGIDGWTFDRETGAEVDDELQWGPKYGVTGSYLVPNDT